MPRIYNSRENALVMRMYRDARNRPMGMDASKRRGDEGPLVQQGLGTKILSYGWVKAFGTYIEDEQDQAETTTYIEERSKQDFRFKQADEKEDAATLVDRLAKYAVIYDSLYQYQQQKKQRWFGSHFDEEVIRDHRFLITSKIRDGIEEILAASPEQRKLREQHLANFIADICAHPELTASNSDDTSTLSLQTTLLTTLLALQTKLDTELLTDQRLAACRLLEETRNNLALQIDAINDILLKLSVPEKIPVNLKDVNILNYLKTNAEYKNLLESKEFGDYINELFIKNDWVSDQRLEKTLTIEDLKKLILDNKSYLLKNDMLLQHLANLLNLRNQLILRHRLLKNTKLDSVTATSDYLADKIMLVTQAQNDFMEFTAELARFKAALVAPFTAKGRTDQTEYKLHFMSIRWVDIMQHFHHFLNQLNALLMHMRLLQSSDTPVASGAAEKPREAAMLPFSPEESFEQSLVFIGENPAVEILSAKVKQQEKEIEELQGQKTALLAQIPALQQKDKYIDTLFDVFNYFLAQYKEHTKEFFAFGFFYNHGEVGRARANRLLDALPAIRDKIKRANYTNAGEIHSALLNELIEMMKNPDLQGNFNKHSLKTYLLAFHRFVATNRDDVLVSYAGKDVFDRFVTHGTSTESAKNIQSEYDAKLLIARVAAVLV